MGKKQTRQNRGARTGGHDHGATTDTKKQEKTSAAQETGRPTPEQVAHKQPRKFGHN
ncbi:hypothetical protein ACFZB6_23355 [Streptomyces syringium]|uniref:hypothetical protein n=1 Tax=Streptomyces TaxID=1883 RepID=UPI0033B6B1CD